MSGVQKIIKYLAMAFAFLLVFSIISGIMSITLSFDNIFDSNDDISDKLENIDINGDVSIIDVNVKSSNIILKVGNILKAETNNKNINVKQDNNKLYITQKKSNLFNNDSDLVIYIPEDFTFDGVSIKTGAGKLDIDELSTKKLYFELGAGKVDINNLTVTDEALIEGGAGSITITNGNIKDLDLDMGVGKLSLTSKVLGNSEIDSGVGEVNLNLVGTNDDYKIKVDKGIGKATINEDKISGNTYYGNGDNRIDIDGGIGSININFVSE